MKALLGTAGVSIGLAASILGALTIALGLRRHDASLLRAGMRAAWVVLGGAVVAALAMEWALITNDFSLVYVANNHSRYTPLVYTIASLWAALEGSIILWSLVLAGYTAAVVHRFRRHRDDELLAWAVLTLLVISAFFFLLMAGPTNPFRTLDASEIPVNGRGPNPLLQNHPLMAAHPPFLYLGYVGFTVPFAFAVAALVTGRLGEGWLSVTRRWTVLAWGALSVGIVLGAWWSYEVLGWGGFWAWDPVENSSFLPWLTGTAYIHSVMVQERRGMLRVWNLSLLLATFSLTILGTFLTRSGVLDSVHSFSQSPIGPWLLTFFGVVVVVSLGLIGWRGDLLRSPGRIDSPLSREGAFLANNLLFAAFAFVVLLGTVFPLIVEALKGERISVGAPYFDRMTTPIALVLLFLMAVAPALPWRKADTEVLRARLQWPAWGGALALVLSVVIGARGLAPLLAFMLGGFAAGAATRQLFLATRAHGLRGLVGRANGGMVVHLGVVVIAVAFTAASSYATSENVTLDEGESATVAGHTVTYLGLQEDRVGDRERVRALIRVDGGEVHAPALTRFPNATQTIGTPSVDWGLREDVYLALQQTNDDGSVELSVIVEPLVSWLWIGGGMMALGTVLSVWPGSRRRPTDPSTATAADEHRPEPELV